MSEASSRQTALATGANDHERVERSSTHAGSLLYRIVMSQQFAIVLVITLFVIFGATQSDQFLRTGTWINILRNAVFIAIVASFTTFVFVSGGLDLSVGSLFLVGAMASAGLLAAGWPVWAAVAIGSAAGALAGLINGVLINYASIPPFITTLGMLYAARSLVVYLTGGQPIAPLPDAFSALARTDLLGLPLLLFYAAGIVIAAQIVLQTTVFGGNVQRALEVASRIEAGICHINSATVNDEPQMPFGGVKSSGYGRFGGKAAIHEFTELRWLTIASLPGHYPI